MNRGKTEAGEGAVGAAGRRGGPLRTGVGGAAGPGVAARVWQRGLPAPPRSKEEVKCGVLG